MKEDRNSELQTFVLKVQFPLCMKTNPKGEVSWGLGVVESDVVAESDQKHPGYQSPVSGIETEAA